MFRIADLKLRHLRGTCFDIEAFEFKIGEKVIKIKLNKTSIVYFQFLSR